MDREQTAASEPAAGTLQYAGATLSIYLHFSVVYGNSTGAAEGV